MRAIDVITQFKKDSEWFSDTTSIRSIPSYKAILKQGNEFIPYLIQDLRQAPSMSVILLLNDITKQQPYPDQVKGNLKQMAAAWVSQYDRISE